MRPLRDDVRVSASLVGVGGDGFVGEKVAIALDGKAELAANGLQFGQADVAQLWAAKAKIAETESETTVGIEFR